MGNWSIIGTALVIGIFFAVIGIILSQINITNPLTEVETSVWNIVTDWITPW